ncbi:MAG: GNAT family N-acetyltransferase [Thermoguttaceae bacterium]
MIFPCQQDELTECLGVIFSRLPESERSLRIQGLFDLFSQGELHLPGIFCAKRNRRIVGGIFSHTRSDKTVLIWPPGIVEGEEEAIRTMLHERMSAYFEEVGAEVAIALCEQWDSIPEQEFEQAGFEYLSDLLYLVANSPVFPLKPGLGDLVFEPVSLDSSGSGFLESDFAGRQKSGERFEETGFNEARLELDEVAIDDYNEQQKERFFSGPGFQELIRLVDRTYEGTLDFPQLCGIAPTEEVLRRYQNDGLFRPDLWWRIRQQGEDVGCLLLTDCGIDSPLELTYVGIVPEFRGRGLAKQIVQFALWKTRGEGRTMMTVSVDRQNSPALHVYQQSGFQIYDRKGMYWKKIGGRE